MAIEDSSTASQSLEAGAFRLVDELGRVRARLGLDGAAPSLVLYDEQQRPRLQLSVAVGGSPRVQLFDGVNAQPQLAIEGDAAGSHVLLAGAGQQKTYLFLKSTGASGLVMINAAGARQAECVLTPEGLSSWSLWHADGTLSSSGGPSANPV